MIRLKKKKIFLRADGDLTTGYGHVIRLLSLAGMLKKKYSCQFIIQQPEKFLKDQILAVCDSIIEIPVSNDYKKEVKHLSEKIKLQDICVIDGYQFDTSYQAVLKEKCFKLVCIDDIHDKHFLADVVINHSEGIDEKKYSKEYYTQLFLGVKYAILRKSFLNNLPVIHTFPKKNIRIFINMGGTDIYNYTCKALKKCLQNKAISDIDIVVGGFYDYDDELKKLIQSNKHVAIDVYSNLSEKKICSLMKKSHAAICSASTVAYEYASVGGALFIYQTAVNQKNIYSFLLKNKIAFAAIRFNEQMELLQKTSERECYFKNKSSYFNGQSDKAILAVFDKFEKERALTLRKAKLSDLLVYYRWTNEKEVRKNSFNQDPIPLHQHTKWFRSKLQNKNTTLYFFKKDKTPLGQIRFDKENNTSEIGYSIDGKFRGKGYGDIILLKAINDYLKTHPGITIVGKVKNDNVASNKIFLKVGFKLQKRDSIKNRYRTYVLLKGGTNK